MSKSTLLMKRNWLKLLSSSRRQAVLKQIFNIWNSLLILKLSVCLSVLPSYSSQHCVSDYYYYWGFNSFFRDYQTFPINTMNFIIKYSMDSLIMWKKDRKRCQMKMCEWQSGDIHPENTKLIMGTSYCHINGESPVKYPAHVKDGNRVIYLSYVNFNIRFLQGCDFIFAIPNTSHLLQSTTKICVQNQTTQQQNCTNFPWI
jgi:hypothetical protein